jgi:hypothetical protein
VFGTGCVWFSFLPCYNNSMGERSISEYRLIAARSKSRTEIQIEAISVLLYRFGIRINGNIFRIGKREGWQSLGGASMAGLCGRWAHCRRLCYAAVLLGLATLVAGERTDSTKSTASGNGLQYATAGVLAEFTVTAKVCTAPPGPYVAAQHLLHDE